jgi:hypothetical protein
VEWDLDAMLAGDSRNIAFPCQISSSSPKGTLVQFAAAAFRPGEGYVAAKEITVRVGDPISIGVALNATGLAWTNAGNLQWIGQANVTHDGISAAQSGAITDNQQTWIETAVTGPGKLTFWWKVSSEATYDYLEFYINGVLQSGRISGEVNWQQQAFDLAAGSQVLRWRYFKDPAVSTGQDHGWVDEVHFLGAPQPFTLSLPHRLPDGSFQWTLSGESGRSYMVQASTNLVQWTDLLTVVPNSSSYQVTDTNAPGLRQRFYRMRTQ